VGTGVASAETHGDASAGGPSHGRPTGGQARRRRHPEAAPIGGKLTRRLVLDETSGREVTPHELRAILG